LERHALEEALRLRERLGGRVTALAMGAPPARRALEEALAAGADRAVFLCDARFAGADTLATARTLSRGIARLGPFDLVLCGNRSATGATGQVGPQLAEFLGVPCVTHVRRLEVPAPDRLLAERALEHGYLRVEVRLPALVAVEKGINTPRLPTVWGIMAAAAKEIAVWNAEDLGLDPSLAGLAGSPTRLVRERRTEFGRRREVFAGPPEEAVRRAVDRLKELGVL
ncbi:MAG: electron transfer flavoprotein subunit beta/FixA family protein, partial [Firmicutes bacterium]|nr:electron transfer flavoprotein subunit beta/FixA family protein [Bacillota bacterium]